MDKIYYRPLANMSFSGLSRKSRLICNALYLTLVQYRIFFENLRHGLMPDVKPSTDVLTTHGVVSYALYVHVKNEL
jgi:hypothetical protein